MYTYLRSEVRSTFDGVRLDTCCNKRTVMSWSQYTAYCSEFGLKGAIDRAVRTVLRGIGGKRMSMCTEKIQVPFTVLRIIIDVDLLILSEDVPALLSMKDMVLNRLDIGIQKRHVTFVRRTQNLSMENYFLIHS